MENPWIPYSFQQVSLADRGRGMRDLNTQNESFSSNAVTPGAMPLRGWSPKGMPGLTEVSRNRVCLNHGALCISGRWSSNSTSFSFVMDIFAAEKELRRASSRACAGERFRVHKLHALLRTAGRLHALRLFRQNLHRPRLQAAQFPPAGTMPAWNGGSYSWNTAAMGRCITT